MSTIVGNIVFKVKATHPDIPPNVVASALAIISGCIILAIGLARCGWIVDLISLTSISAFMTGSALNIAVGQVPTLMGLTGFSSRDSTYLVVINSLSHLHTTTLDAAMGLTALAMLYIIRSVCKLAAKKFPKHHKAIFFVSTLRTVFVILLYTLISYLVNRNIAGNNASKARFKILGTVPRGMVSITKVLEHY
jgi:sodium-independent sulfate anion transporter 11